MTLMFILSYLSLLPIICISLMTFGHGDRAFASVSLSFSLLLFLCLSFLLSVCVIVFFFLSFPNLLLFKCLSPFVYISIQFLISSRAPFSLKVFLLVFSVSGINALLFLCLTHSFISFCFHSLSQFPIFIFTLFLSWFILNR